MSDRPFSPGLKTVLAGSMPHADPGDACRLIFEYCPDIPYWPQLSHRAFNENMYAQYSERFPGVILEHVLKLTSGVSKAMPERYI